jgi:hypothetical protein
MIEKVRFPLNSNKQSIMGMSSTSQNINNAARNSPFLKYNKPGVSTGVNESELDDIFYKTMNE